MQHINLGDGAIAAMSLRDLSRPANYSMRRTGPHAALARDNIADFARIVGFDVNRLVLPRRWPHLGRTMVVTSANVVPDPMIGLNPYLLPADQPGFEHSCDALVTTTRGLCIGAQAADCPMLYLYDPRAGIVGLVHCGWKPVAQRIVHSTIRTFQGLGSSLHDIRAHVGPGAGDEVYEFAINGDSRPLLEAQGRIGDFASMLHPHATKPGTTILRLNGLVVQDLMTAGIDPANITNDARSCIEDDTLHSYRRDGTADMATSPHGLGIGVIYLS
jgi:copper oxidase (laccase) domain-containing protein